MLNRSQKIVEYQGEGSAEQRIAAWKGGFRMVLAHPITGVGIGSFITALPHFYDTSPRVAHNTFVQFIAESGVVAGIAYLAVVLYFFINFRNIRLWCREFPCLDQVARLNLYNCACFSSFCGLFICSMFLSLNTYEIFFVLLVINNSILNIIKKQVDAKIGEGLLEEEN